MRNTDKDFIRPEPIAAGDQKTLTDVYKVYRDRVYAFAYRMLGVQSIAEEITHEAFLALIKDPERYDPARGSILTYLCTIARSCILMHFRSLGDEIKDSFDEGDFVPESTGREPDPLSFILDQELAAKVNDSILWLPALQREAIILREFQELSYQEISIVAGVDINVVKARLHRARQNLGKRLAPYVVTKGDRYYELR
jgi:RNA polymerase sigma-70 factor (ECF subfamily)